MNHIKQNINIILAIAFAVIITSCGSKKSLEKTDTTITTTPGAIITTPEKPATVQEKNVVAKLDINISDKQKGGGMSVDGKLQMRRDEIVRLLITPYGIMEAGRLEFTPDYVILVDRINKEYVKAKYSDIDFLKKNNINFGAIQEQFWNEYKKQHITLDIDKMQLKIDVKSVSNSSSWDVQTTLSDKYRQVSVAEVLKKLSGM